MNKEDDLDRTFCDRVCTFALSQELRMCFQGEIYSRTGFERHMRKDLRHAVINRQIHYYKRDAAGIEHEVPPPGFLPHQIEEHLNPPATEEQLQATEALLGFALPPLLRTLYKHVANGGFGPGQGLFGALGGGDRDGYLLTNEYLFQKADQPSIDLSTCARVPVESTNDWDSHLSPWEIVVPHGYWPGRLLPLISKGCATFFYLDSPSGRVFYSGNYTLRLRLAADSLEDFLEMWMCGPASG